jgi:hypothetical protein
MDNVIVWCHLALGYLVLVILVVRYQAYVFRTILLFFLASRSLVAGLSDLSWSRRDSLRNARGPDGVSTGAGTFRGAGRTPTLAAGFLHNVSELRSCGLV